MPKDQSVGARSDHTRSANAASKRSLSSGEESKAAARRKRKAEPSATSKGEMNSDMSSEDSGLQWVRRFEGTNSRTAKVLEVRCSKALQWNHDQLLDEYWKNLRDALDAIYDQRPITRSIEYLYQTVHDMCTIPSQTENLFRDLSEDCCLYATRLLDAMLESETDLLTWLRNLEEVWSVFCENMELIRCIFLPLDRKLPNFGTIWNMGLKIFENVILLNVRVKEKSMEGLLWLVKCERAGEHVDKMLVKGLFQMLSTVDVYASLLEKRFLRTTESYYEAEGRRLINEVDVPAYMNYVNDTLGEEKERLDFYVGSESGSALLAAAQRGLIGHHLSAMLDKAELGRASGGSNYAVLIYYIEGLNDMLDHFRIEQLHLLYKLCRHAPIGHETLCNAVSVYLTRVGKELACSNENEDSIVPELLSLKDKFDRIIAESFENNQLFLNSFRLGFEEIILSCPHKPAELIARFIDSKLRSGRVILAEEDLDRLMDKVLVLFRFVPGKDMFEAFYQKYLAKRLLQSKSASFDAEKALLSKLKQECGSDFTAKLEMMFRDIELSKELNSSFKQTLLSPQSSDKPPLDMSVNVLTASSWPTYISSSVTLPTDMSTNIERFQEFYLSKHSGRSLKWQYSLGTCVVLGNFPSGNEKELLVSTYQAIVLLLFNTKNELTFGDIKASTAIEDEELRRTLQSLACGKFRVITKHPMSKDVADTDTFTFNSRFHNKMRRIKINQIQMKETEEDKEHTYEQVRQGRMYQVDASTVRIMKMKKKLSHNALIAELSTQLRFQAKPNELKERIESMIEQGYLCRDKENPNIYSYIA